MSPTSTSSASSQVTPERVVELTVNLDDVSGEVVGDAASKLLSGGALDVWTTPIQMKKQRPGVMLSVLCSGEAAQATARRILELTGSFGVRFREWDRLVLDREHITLPTALGGVSIKVGRLDGKVISAQPEFDSTQALADSLNLPLRQVMDTARAAAERWRERQDG